MDKLVRTLSLLTNLFPVWVVAFAVAALWDPSLFHWFGPLTIYALGVIMLGMGVTLTAGDFLEVLRAPKPIAIGFVAQFTIMPFMGWLIAATFDLPTELAVGIILVACCPGGTASNVVTYLARGHLALSVLMTTCSTFGAIVITPLLTKWLVGERLPVDAAGLLLSTVKVVLLPVIAGVLLNRYLPRTVERITTFSPLVSVIAIAMICASAVGDNRDLILTYFVQLGAAVVTLHAGGFALGYAFAWLLGYDSRISRTISIEVGMQNSGLGVVLAREHFANPVTHVAIAAAPCALSSVAHSVIGSLLAVYWRRKSVNSSNDNSLREASTID
ncbi:bile acid:sodium symporter family protein [Aeoliella sp. SH292]|uniref:bile acid:sodium symporter family protein n=1 Tax=Aeoliella sp. SH292 TaxID=3454464 RepID=UPI003F9A443C